MISILTGNNIDVMRSIRANSIDAVVTDPPYGIRMMGSRWDYDVPSVEFWTECMRVLKPGAHVLSFSGTRTYHRMTVHLEDAGFVIRDMIAWIYGEGMPKSLNISKAIDKQLGVASLVVGQDMRPIGGDATYNGGKGQWEGGGDITVATSPEAIEWEGWGTGLKPAMEPIVMARKPFDQTVALNVLEWGTGGINIDKSRVPTDDKVVRPQIIRYDNNVYGVGLGAGAQTEPDGRWPANVAHDGSDEVVSLFPSTGPARKAERGKGIDGNTFKNKNGQESGVRGHNDNGGSAARFFYCAKAAQREREAGLDDFEYGIGGGMSGTSDGSLLTGSGNQRNNRRRNTHPTVKPIRLMRWLVGLVTPPNGIVLDPFVGSGTTGIACAIDGFEFIGIDYNAEFTRIAKARIDYWSRTNEESNTIQET